MTPEARLLDSMAKEAVKRLVRCVILELQRMRELLSGDDSGLANVWDEICVQKQSEESFLWDAYDDTVRATVEKVLEKVSITEVQAIWLQTDEGEDWLVDNDEEDSDIPWFQDDVVEYIMQEVYGVAANWSNRRIRRYLDNHEW